MTSLRTCRCGKRMKATNTWQDKTRYLCPECGRVRVVKHIIIAEVSKLKIATGSTK